MNDFTKEDLIYGFTIVPETYCRCVHTPLTKREKRKIFIYKAKKMIKEMIVEVLWFVFLMIGITLQISGFAYLAGIFFKMGAS
jgi:hypothetical protein